MATIKQQLDTSKALPVAYGEKLYYSPESIQYTIGERSIVVDEQNSQYCSIMLGNGLLRRLTDINFSASPKSKFKIGDLVALKSGSPFFTVKESSEDGRSVGVVFWNEEKQRFEYETFHQDMLLSEADINGKQIADVSV